MIFNNKRVAFIGPAEHTSTLYQKEKIEGYDVVVRLNLCYPINDKVKEMTGDRIDVLFCGGGIFCSYDGKFDFGEVGQIRVLLKYLIGSHYLNNSEYLRKVYKKVVITNSIAYWSMRERLGSQPTMGMVAITDILYEKPKELYITGMTFYQTPYFDGYYGDKGIKRNEARDCRAHIRKNDKPVCQKSHHPANELRYFIDNYYCLNSVSCDSVLEEIVNG